MEQKFNNNRLDLQVLREFCKRLGGKNGPIVYDLVGDAKVDWVPLYKKGQA